MEHYEVRAAAISIAQAYARANQVTPQQTARLVIDIENVISELATTRRVSYPGRRLSPLAQLYAASGQPKIDPMKSVFHDYIVCIECGERFATLRRHLNQTHHLKPHDYFARWNLPNRYPLISPAYFTKRSEMAKGAGLGRKMVDARRSKAAQARNAT